MFKRTTLGLIVAAVLPGAVLAKSDAPETLKRSGPWVVDYDRDACHLYAEFGTGKDVLVMRFTRYEPIDGFDFSLYGSRLATADPRSKAKLDFGLRGAPVEAQSINGKAGALNMMLFGAMRLDGWERASPEDVAPSLPAQSEAAVSGVNVAIRRKKPFRLEFGSLGKPMASLRACQSDLLKKWGYDPVVQTTLARPARPTNSPVDWLNSGDYPMGAVMSGQNGIVQFRLDVDAGGKVVGCHVLARSNPDVFADVTCRGVSRRAKLEPALDAGGKPVRSFYVQKVRWQMGS